MKRKNEFKLSDLLDVWLKTSGGRERYLEQKISEEWRFLMGEEIFRQTKKIKLTGNEISFKLESPELRNELKYAKKKILEHLNENLKGQIHLEKVKFKA